MPTIVDGSLGITYPVTAGGTSAVQASSAKVLQVVSVQSGTVTTTTSAIPLDNTIPQNTEGAELFTASITPTRTSSKLLIQVTLIIAPNPANWIIGALFQDSIANALACSFGFMTTSTGAIILSFNHYMNAGTTSATTFKVRYGAPSGTTTINGSNGTPYFNGVASSSMTIMEIAE
jgi:hypothetical protein